jgi:hypothetical protein
VAGVSSDSNILTRVERLENDRDSLYELIDEFRDETRAQFARIDARFEGIEGRLGGIGGTLVEVVRRLPEPR